MSSPTFERIEKAYRHDADSITIDLPSDTTGDEMNHRYIPFALGYYGRTHGLVHVSWTEKVMRFELLADPDEWAA